VLAVEALKALPANRTLVKGMIFSELSSENSYFFSAKRRFRKVDIFSYFSLSSENSYAFDLSVIELAMGGL